jgi:hypothetical protein
MQNNLLNTTDYYLRDASGNVLSMQKLETTSLLPVQNVVLKTTEYSLYGSDRLGVRKEERIRSQGPYAFVLIDSRKMATKLTEPCKYSRWIGQSNYEMKDHLGNVRCIVNEKLKTEYDAVSNSFSPLQPKVTAAYNYYVFGSPRPNVYSASNQNQINSLQNKIAENNQQIGELNAQNQNIDKAKKEIINELKKL